MSGLRDSMRTLAVRGYYTTKWVMLQPGELCSTSLWVVVTWVPLENLELRVGALMRSGGGAELSLQEEGGGAIKPSVPGPPFCRGNKVSLGRMVEAGGGKWRMRRM